MGKCQGKKSNRVDFQFVTEQFLSTLTSRGQWRMTSSTIMFTCTYMRRVD